MKNEIIILLLVFIVSINLASAVTVEKTYKINNFDNRYATLSCLNLPCRCNWENKSSVICEGVMGTTPSAIRYSDDVRETKTGAASDYPGFMFQINLSQPISEISNIKYYVEGYSVTSGNGFNVYWYNFSNDLWILFNKTNSATEQIAWNMTSYPPVYANVTNQSGTQWISWILVESNVAEAAGSCPFIYSWDGNEYVMESEAISHYITNYFQGTTYQTMDNAVLEDGYYAFKITEELDETSYIDEFNAYEVESPTGTIAMADINGNIHTLSENEILLPSTTSFTYLNTSDISTWQYYTYEFDEPVNKIVFKLIDSGINWMLWKELVVDVFGDKFWVTEKIHEKFPSSTNVFTDSLNSVSSVQAEYFNGSEWILVNYVFGGASFWERKLIALPEMSSEIRFKMRKDFYYIKDVYADNSEDEIIKITELKQEQPIIPALINDDKDYLELEQGEYVKLKYESTSNTSNKISVITSTHGFYRTDAKNHSPSWIELGKDYMEFLRYEYQPDYFADKAYNTFNISYTDSEGRAWYSKSIYLDYFYMNVTYTQGTDTLPPIVNLETPANNAYFYPNVTMVFYYNFSEGNITSNCSLNIDGTLNLTNKSMNGEQGFSNNFVQIGFTEMTQHNWTINCSDNSNNVGNATPRNFTVARALMNTTLTPTGDITVTQGNIYNYTLNVTCFNNDCQNLYVGLRYNKTGTEPDTLVWNTDGLRYNLTGTGGKLNMSLNWWKTRFGDFTQNSSDVFGLIGSQIWMLNTSQLLNNGTCTMANGCFVDNCTIPSSLRIEHIGNTQDTLFLAYTGVRNITYLVNYTKCLGLTDHNCADWSCIQNSLNLTLKNEGSLITGLAYDNATDSLYVLDDAGSSVFKLNFSCALNKVITTTDSCLYGNLSYNYIGIGASTLEWDGKYLWSSYYYGTKTIRIIDVNKYLNTSTSCTDASGCIVAKYTVKYSTEGALGIIKTMESVFLIGTSFTSSDWTYKYPLNPFYWGTLNKDNSAVLTYQINTSFTAGAYYIDAYTNSSLNTSWMTNPINDSLNVKLSITSPPTPPSEGILIRRIIKIIRTIPFIGGEPALRNS